MSVRDDLFALSGEIQASLAVCDKVLAFYDEFRGKSNSKSRTTENAIIMSDIAERFYTCLETIFVRVGQFFENSIDPTRWHKDILRKMTISIPNIREPVISGATYHSLSELLRFRHFKRYYLEFDYDWDRLELIIKKIDAVRTRVRREIEDYIRYIESLAEEAE